MKRFSSCGKAATDSKLTLKLSETWHFSFSRRKIDRETALLENLLNTFKVPENYEYDFPIS